MKFTIENYKTHLWLLKSLLNTFPSTIQLLLKPVIKAKDCFQ